MDARRTVARRARRLRKAHVQVSRTYRNESLHQRSRERRRKPRFLTASDEFRCRHCRAFVGALPSGGRHRNHCPFCLYSRHVDGKTPGDRASDCGGSMAPAGVFTRMKGEHAIVHRCHDCGIERYCRVAADDDIAAMMRLPVVQPRWSSRGTGGAARAASGR